MNPLKLIQRHAYVAARMREYDEMLISPEPVRRAYAERLCGQGVWTLEFGQAWLEHAGRTEAFRQSGAS